MYRYAGKGIGICVDIRYMCRYRYMCKGKDTCVGICIGKGRCR